MMKIRKTIGGILFGLGCALTFIGLIALILPTIENDQLKLVLASFDTPSDHLVVSLMNSGMSFAMHNGWKVLICGAVTLIIGLLLFTLFTREPKPDPRPAPYQRPAPVREPIWESQFSSPERQPNPFADLALWDQQFAPQKSQQQEHAFTAFGGPMLEPNRIEDEPVYRFAADAYARPVEAAPQADVPVEAAYEPVNADLPPIPPAPVLQPVAPVAAVQMEKAGAFSSAPAADPVPEKKAEPVYTPNEEPDEPIQISSRIRSTMGKHRDR